MSIFRSKKKKREKDLTDRFKHEEGAVRILTIEVACLAEAAGIDRDNMEVVVNIEATIEDVGEGVVGIEMVVEGAINLSTMDMVIPCHLQRGTIHMKKDES